MPRRNRWEALNSNGMERDGGCVIRLAGTHPPDFSSILIQEPTPERLARLLSEEIGGSYGEAACERLIERLAEDEVEDRVMVSVPQSVAEAFVGDNFTEHQKAEERIKTEVLQVMGREQRT